VSGAPESHPDGDPGRDGDAGSPLARPIYTFVGVLLVGIGALGAALPVLPTTPFLLLASFFLVRGSPRLHRRLLRSRLFGPFLRDWDRYRGVRAHIKVKAVVVVSCVVALTLWLSDLGAWAKVALVALALLGIGVVLSLKTIREDGRRGKKS
jgi:uncharacterized membrane protein YbaN (DUF454 family)